VPQVLKTLSQLLRSPAALLTADDLAEIDDGPRDFLLKSNVLKPARTATHVVCDHCQERHVEEVTRVKRSFGAAVFRIHCPEAGWVEIPGDRLRQWSLDVDGLVSLLAKSVQGNAVHEELIPGAAWRLGDIEIADAIYTILLVRGIGRSIEATIQQIDKMQDPARTILVTAADSPPAMSGFAGVVTLASAFRRAGDGLEFQLDRACSALQIRPPGTPAKTYKQSRAWPRPEEHTTAKVWTVKDGALRMSTKTDGRHDGTVEFAPTTPGELTYQMRFMQTVCLKFPRATTLAEVIEQVYPDDWAKVRQNPGLLKSALRKLRSLVSDIRNRKLAKAGLNPDILPSLSIEASMETGIALRLAHLHRMDDKDLDDADEAVP